MDTKSFVDDIVELILGKKGSNIKVLDLKELTTIADYFVICSAPSDIQVRAIADEVNKKLRDRGIRCYHQEGFNSLSWVLLDYFDVVVHVFRNDARDFYGLEKLWGDAPTKIIAESIDEDNFE